MASPSTFEETTPPLKRGDHRAPLPTDLRSPCPIVNALANHGYIPRDGRNVSYNEIKIAMNELGLASTVRTVFTYGGYLEHMDTPPRGLWAFIRNPLAYFLQPLGLRDLGQRDSRGDECLNLDQFARHNAVEHDVSMSRRDFAQGDNHTSQQDLVAQIVNSSSDGEILTTEDFARLRKRRLTQQQHDNPKLVFGAAQESLAYGEVALIQTVFGHGRPNYNVPVPYVKALFEDERLPTNEGWRKRTWWTLGFVELTAQAQKVRKTIAAIS